MPDVSQKSKLKLVHDYDQKWTPDIAEAEFKRLYRAGEVFRKSMLGTKGKKPAKRAPNGGLCLKDEWNRPHDQKYLQSVAGAGANLGIRTKYLPIFDVDCPNQKISDAVLAAIATELGVPTSALSVRCRGDSAKVAVLRALAEGAEPFAKMSVAATSPDGETQKLEILGDGQQGVIAGVHPDGARLEIRGPHPADIGPEKMIKVDRAIARRILDAAAAGPRRLQARRQE
jgi:hypothetical protein